MNERLKGAVRSILEARKTGVLMDRLEPGMRPHSLDEGYVIQSAATERWPDEVAGWKVGATSLEIQRLFGISEPVFGPVFKRCVFQSPATVSAMTFPHRMVETEFAFRFADRLPPRSKPYARDEIVAAVGTLVPAFEIVSPRFTTLTIKDIPQLVADFCGNGGAVLGTPCTDWRALDLPSHAASLSIAGAARQRGTGRLVLGNPLNVLEWFVNSLMRYDKCIEAGQFVMTGSVTGLHVPELGQATKSEFGSLGTVELTFV
jgi:2-keto-4-pentenoate hydratase